MDLSGQGRRHVSIASNIPLTKGLTPVYLATASLRGNGVLDLIVAEFDTDTIGVLLGNGDGTFGIETEYNLPQAPAALVVADFNHDGKLDIVSVMDTVNYPSTLGVPYLATLLGDGTGSFGNPIITNNPGFYSSAQSIAAGDVNGDGFPDVLITGPGLENSQVYLNMGNGTFSPGATIGESGSFNSLQAGQLADVNGDGCLDAIVADANGQVWISEGDCAGNFTFTGSVPMGDSNVSLAVVDMNGDGHLDIVTTTAPLLDGDGLGDVAGNMLTVAIGDGKGNFTSGRDYVGTGMSYSFAIADFNGDGHPDAVSASPDTDTATVWMNDGSGGFGFPQGEWIGTSGPLNNPVAPPSFVDVNGDGKPDVVTLNEGYNGEYLITTMLNDGTGRFAAPVTSDAGVSITSHWMGDYRLGDFRNTGHLDFVGIGLAANLSGSTQYIVFVPGNGDGTFGKSTVTPITGAQGALAMGDFNRDGKLDIAAVGANPSGSGSQITAFLGNGDGTFRSAGTFPITDSAASIGRVFVGDFNRDGKLDILVYDTANGYWTNSSYVWEFLGNGDGTFQPGQQLFSAFQPMTMADVSGDSWLDIERYDFMWPDGTTETLGPAKFTTYLGQPSGAFSQSSTYAPYNGVPIEVNGFAFGDPTTSSMVADLNGDGKPDEVAFQLSALGTGDVYAQILKGNGDGTFTPTFDIFDFQKDYYVPRYAHIFDGTTFSDLLEVDDATSSMSVFKSGPAPAVQLQLEQAQVSGNSNCGWVFLNVPSSSSTTVALATSVAGITLPATVTVPAGALSQQFCFNLGPSYDWHQVFDVQATLGSDTAVTYASQEYIFGFSEALSTSGYLYVYPTQSTAPVTMTLTSSQGYTSTVQLSCEGLLAGESCAFGSNPLTIPPNGTVSTTVVVNATSSAPPITTANVVVVASDSEVTTRQSFNVTVSPLVLYSTSLVIPTTSPGTGTGQITILGIPPYSTSCIGPPAGISCSFNNTISSNPNSDSFINLNVTVASGIAPGSYPFTLQVVSGPETQTASVTVDVGGFTVQPPSPATTWALAGQTSNPSVNFPSVNGYVGMVTATCSTNFGGTCVGGSTIAGEPLTLAISVPSTVAVGTYSVTVTATSGQDVQTLTFPFYVADYGGSLNSSTLTIARGGIGSLAAMISATTGFVGTVSLSCSGATQLTCNFAPSAVQPIAGTPQTVTLTITASQSASLPPAEKLWKATLLLLGVFLSLVILVAFSNPNKMRTKPVAVGLMISLFLFSTSCGGGNSVESPVTVTPSGGSNSYTLTVTATAAGTSTARNIGSINVTVTH